jgi:hypothetical protein
MTARRRGMTEEAADAAIDQACRMLRMPTIRNSFADHADRAASEQMSYRRRQVAPASPRPATWTRHRGLATRWNSGPIEGCVNHIKMLKRQMFGRASLPLVRKRVLLTASR